MDFTPEGDWEARILREAKSYPLSPDANLQGFLPFLRAVVEDCGPIAQQQGYPAPEDARFFVAGLALTLLSYAHIITGRESGEPGEDVPTIAPGDSSVQVFAEETELRAAFRRHLGRLPNPDMREAVATMIARGDQRARAQGKS